MSLIVLALVLWIVVVPALVLMWTLCIPHRVLDRLKAMAHTGSEPSNVTAIRRAEPPRRELDRRSA